MDDFDLKALFLEVEEAKRNFKRFFPAYIDWDKFLDYLSNKNLIEELDNGSIENDKYWNEFIWIILRMKEIFLSDYIKIEDIKYAVDRRLNQDYNNRMLFQDYDKE